MKIETVVKVIAVLVIAAIVGYRVYLSQKVVAFSNIALANIEALADASEGGVSCTATVNCANGSVSCTGVSGCVQYSTYVECCDSSGNAHYSYCGC